MAHKTVGPLAVEVIADSSGKYVGNALRFDTVDEAKSYGADLFMRWTAVRKWRVIEVESAEPFVRGKVLYEEG
jgi:hypothetical protein